MLALMIMLAQHGYGERKPIIHHLEKGGHKIRECHFKGMDVLPARRGSHHKPYHEQPEILGRPSQGLGRCERNSGRHHKA